jgi:anhydro-N-acetylmuramic acid kinase
LREKLIKLIKKNSKTVIGLLSGTSVDGIDAVLMNISGSGQKTKISIIDFRTYKIPEQVRTEVLANSLPDSARIDSICRLNVILGKLFADAVKRLCRQNNISLKDIDLIGSHGQTIHHLPGGENYAGFKIKSTLQIGDPSIISNMTGITTVGDLRIGDCASGGDGAPLVPYLDYILFTSKTKNRALLNIGGISNITILKKNCSKGDVIAFDTGPGNMLIDGLTQKLFGKKFDRDGMIAEKGELNREFFAKLLEEDYYKKRYPKSTGRERYGEHFQKKLLNASEGINKYDIIRTVTEYTAYTVWYNYDKQIKRKVMLEELFISGGGAHNKMLVKLLKAYFDKIKIMKVDMFGINADNKEAVLFGILANECINNIPANMTSVTGSKGDAILGKICQGVPK